ncbi:MAG: DEAD/DEAH box helicase [Candidatus Bathyarchaeota archaeon]|nr:DEAD/DEAH box helicase [Candidatus Bathyarchaeota archaeon]
MRFDPVDLAKEMEIAYATDFIGDKNILFASILKRYGDPSLTLREKLPHLVKMRGPFIQALPIPKWSPAPWTQFSSDLRAKYAPNGIDIRLSALFSNFIRRLYAFQENAITSILNDKNTLVVAGTGRGKTESWLIPILNFALLAKRGKVPEHPRNSVKAILVYPTKALAQDQLKRLIKYLFELNRNLPESERITIGVYDGDTPNQSDQNHMNYLIQAFRYFKCPQFDSEKYLCRLCDSELNGCSLIVKREKDIPQLCVPTSKCKSKIPLDFIHLTKEDIRESNVDILLTNPDIINYRLININADQDREAFVKQPKFLVLDEVHIYSGLFGSFVSQILRRYQLVRKELLGNQQDDLRIIAASATISNKAEIFSKVTSIDDFAVIEEEHTQIGQDFPDQIPHFWLSTVFSKDMLINEYRKYLNNSSASSNSNGLFTPLLNAFNIAECPTRKLESDKDLEDFLAGSIFESITKTKDHPELSIIRALHFQLLHKASLPEDIKKIIEAKYPHLGKNQVDNLIENFFNIGELSGILENRIHLFAWPVDGFYTCINCGTIYEDPQSECEKCHHHFITKMTACRECDEEAVESWFCPKCLKLTPVISSVEGKNVAFDVPTCDCTGEHTSLIKVIWRPFFKCKKCGKIVKKNYTEHCDKCGSRMLLDEQGKNLTCTNPACLNYQVPQPTKRCSNCQSELELLTSETVVCPKCGSKIAGNHTGLCDCGAAMHPILHLPWVCDNDNCREVINSVKPPATCKCGSKNFYLAGLFDFTYAYSCPESQSQFAVPDCGHTDHESTFQNVDFKEYRLLDQNLKIQRPIASHKAVPCYHKGKRYNRKRFMPLARAPDNVAVTSSQHALRKIVGHSDLTGMPIVLKGAKVLSFSDSHNDMERLNRFFQEPEAEWFVDQLMISALEKGENTLSELYSNVLKELNLRQEIYDSARTYGVDLLERISPRYQTRQMAKEKFLNEEIDVRLFGGMFFGKFQNNPHISKIVSSGIIDLRLNLDETLSKEETHFLKNLYTMRTITVEKFVEKVMLEESFDLVLDRLKTKKLVLEEKGRLRINPDKIICNLVSKDRPMLWNPEKDEFKPTILSQLGDDTSNCVNFSRKYNERVDLFKPNYSKTAFRINYSSPIMLLSEAYKGSTDKTRRRELEFQFKNGIYPNFLSSGPAMELGIDIGDLDILCLFGTPPNINSYLQRIGRAGRASKKSLVFTVSKRNPIDYYYYRNPLELIQSNAQPVPLNEHNPEVMKISLSWALFDFIAARFWIPWKKETRPDGNRISDGEEFVRKGNQTNKPDDIQTFTSVYNSKNSELNNGDRLGVLQKVIDENRVEARLWLKGLLDYSFCPKCGRRYSSVYQGKCQTNGCLETVVNASERFSDMIEDTLNNFGKHFSSLGKDFVKEIRIERRKLRDQLDDIEEKKEGKLDAEEEQRLNLQQKSAEESDIELYRLQQDVEKMLYSKFHTKTPEGKYAFDIRKLEDEIDVVYYKEDQNEGRFTPMLEARGIQMALKEYHPYSVTTFSRQKRVTCRVTFDSWRREEVKKIFPDVLFCPRCFSKYDDLGKQECDCGGPLKMLETHTPNKVEVYPTNYPLRVNVETGRGQLKPSEIHSADPKETVKSTIPNVETKVIEFKPTLSWVIKNNNGMDIGSIDYGELKLATLTDSYRNIYENGYVDRVPKHYEICGEPDCNWIVSQQGNHVCCRNPSHDSTLKKYIRLASIFTTFGIRMKISGDEAVTHTLAHGLRLGLQNAAGVHIRNIGEVLDEEYSYVYDNEPGGSGVTTLVTAMEDGKYKNFIYIMKLFETHLSRCKCDDGCPSCIFQYGCATMNDPRGLSRKKTLQWFADGVQLVEAETEKA